MNRNELMQRIAFMSDEELNECVQLFLKGGNILTVEVSEETPAVVEEPTLEVVEEPVIELPVVEEEPEEHKIIIREPIMVKLHKHGSIIEQLKEQLPDDDIFDILKTFGVEDLLEGGLKKGSRVSILIVLDERQPEEPSRKLQLIEIGDKVIKAEVVSSEEDMEKGLGNRESLDKDCGMLFDFGKVEEEITFNCEEMQFPIDIIFINGDDEVIRVAENCQPGKDLFTENNVRYVLELNAKSGVKPGDELDLNPESTANTMKILAPDGSTLMELHGGERIFSRKKTKQLIKWAKRADESKSDSDFKRLGKLIFDEIDAQDNRPAEYVEVPED